MSSASAVRQKRCLILRRNEENLTVAHLEFHCGSENLCIIKHVFCYTVQKLSALFILICRGMTSSKYPSLCVTTFSASFTNFMVLLPQSLHNRPIRALNSAPNCRKKTLIYVHTTEYTLPVCDINLGSLTLPAPEAGDFVEVIFLYLFIIVSFKRFPESLHF
jgi:hypothetical protein